MREALVVAGAAFVVACSGNVVNETADGGSDSRDSDTRYPPQCLAPDGGCSGSCLYGFVHTDFRRSCNERLLQSFCIPSDNMCLTGEDKCWIRLDDPGDGAYFFCSDTTLSSARWRLCTADELSRTGKVTFDCKPESRTISPPLY